MLKTALACVATAGVCFTITATSGLGSAGTVTVRAGSGGARFPVADVLCVAELASGAPRFREPGVACASVQASLQRRRGLVRSTQGRAHLAGERSRDLHRPSLTWHGAPTTQSSAGIRPTRRASLGAAG